MRRLVIVAAVLGGLFVGGNQIAEQVGERVLSDAVARSFDLEGEVAVEFLGGPFVVDVLRGHLDGLRLSADGQAAGGLRLQRLDIELRDLNLDGSAFGDGPLELAVGGQSATATVGAAALNRYLRARGEDATVTLGDGVVTVHGRQSFAGVSRKVTATGMLSIEGRELRFVATDVTWEGPSFPGAEAEARRRASFREGLPNLPGGIRITDVRVTPGSLRFEAVGAAKAFVVRP